MKVVSSEGLTELIQLSKDTFVDKGNLANVATSGEYSDLLNKPTIPAAQVQSDWNATSGMGVILNKPTIPAAQVQSDWNATSGMGVILNKPTWTYNSTTETLIWGSSQSSGGDYNNPPAYDLPN